MPTALNQYNLDTEIRNSWITCTNPSTFSGDTINIQYGTAVPPVTVTSAGTIYQDNIYNYLQNYVGTQVTPNLIYEMQNTVNTYRWNYQTTTGTAAPEYIVNLMPDATGAFSVQVTGGNYVWGVAGVLPDKASLVKAAIHKNLFAGKRRRAVGLSVQASSEELKARETLRDMITEAEWRRYLTNGFIMTKGQSGKWYQIFQSSSERVRVYEKGKHIENLCIHSDKECPPTDHVINMKILAEIDEQTLWTGANKHGAYKYAEATEILENDIHGVTYFRPGEIQYHADGRLREAGECLPIKILAIKAKNLVQMVRDRYPKAA